MIDEKYLLGLLEDFEKGSYQGCDTSGLIESRVTDSGDTPPGATEEGQRFKYHMDELWSGGFIRSRDVSSDHWGLKVSGNDNWTIIERRLVLTPAGSALLEELRKPKGLEKLKNGLKTAGISAGSAALQAAVSSAFTT